MFSKQQSESMLGTIGPNPTTSIYNATGSLARFENKNSLFYFEKRSSLLHTPLAL
jgi:hypothetical protein